MNKTQSVDKLYLCLTGTDTDAGKTAITAALARAAADKGLRVLIIKAVQTGCTRDAAGNLLAPDLAVYREACPKAEIMACALFEPACSPHLAARQTGATLSAKSLAEEVLKAVRESAAELVLLEGAGGLLTPLNEQETLADLFAMLDWPLLLVGANKLGVVNHALLSLIFARSRNLPVPGFVLTSPCPADDASTTAIRADNAAIIVSLGRCPCLAKIYFVAELHSADPQVRTQGWASLAEAVRPVLDTVQPGRDAKESDSDAELLHFDRKHLWHPYTSALKPLPTREVVSTLGARIRLRDGRELVDGMSSWWCAVHGYRHPRLMEALREQSGRMPHVMFGGLTHEPAVDLARKLLDIAPSENAASPALRHVFFADSGSVAVEVAIKMALQYQQAVGHPERSRLLTVRGGYHGDTLGAMSVCDPVTGMHGLFSTLVPQQIFAPRPECRFDASYDPAPAEAFATLLAERAGDIAAVILEPVLQGAGGMWMYHPDYLRRMRELCREHGCLLILDEIATGFGRTGRLFACEHAGIAPDILCLGKALTGGVMTLAATLATAEVAEGLSRDGGVLMHGPTFMANPLACAVAGTSLDLLAEGGWRNDVPRLERLLRQGLEPCRNAPGVADVRVLGAVGVLEMDAPVNVERLQTYFADAWNVWIRPFNKLIYVMPPYVSRDEDIETLTAAMRGAVEEGQWQ